MYTAHHHVMMSSLSAILILMTTIGWTEASSDSCDKYFSLRGPEMTALINRTYPSCDQRNLSIEMPICQIDYDNTVDTCHAPPGRLPALPACPDGTWNRTCYPRSSRNLKSMECVCHSTVKMTDTVRETKWTNWEILDPPENGVHYRRRLTMDTECIGQEFGTIHLKPIVSTHNLPDSVYTASSYWGNQHEAYRARIDNYLTFSCAWLANRADLTNPWLAIALPTEYLIKGIIIKKRCDPPYAYQHVTMVTVSTSHDDVTYQDVVVREDLSDGYNDDQSAYVVFTQVYPTRFWLIHVNSFITEAAMKCDLLGI